ncbi:hypothetical protein ACWCW7_34490 [Nocardia tengchongensis]
MSQVDLPDAIAGLAVTLVAYLLMWAVMFAKRANSRLNEQPEDEAETDDPDGDAWDRGHDQRVADEQGAW